MKLCVFVDEIKENALKVKNNYSNISYARKIEILTK